MQTDCSEKNRDKKNQWEKISGNLHPMVALLTIRNHYAIIRLQSIQEPRSLANDIELTNSCSCQYWSQLEISISWPVADFSSQLSSVLSAIWCAFNATCNNSYMLHYSVYMLKNTHSVLTSSTIITFIIFNLKQCLYHQLDFLFHGALQATVK